MVDRESATDAVDGSSHRARKRLGIGTVKLALVAVERPGISGAIVDRALSDGDASPICERLHERGIPFVIYSGYDPTGRGACVLAPHLEKPATEMQLVTAVVDLIFRQSPKP